MSASYSVSLLLPRPTAQTGKMCVHPQVPKGVVQEFAQPVLIAAHEPLQVVDAVVVGKPVPVRVFLPPPVEILGRCGHLPAQLGVPGPYLAATYATGQFTWVLFPA